MRTNAVFKTVAKIFIVLLSFCAASAFADNTIGSLAGNLSNQFKQIGQLMAGVAYVAGFGLTMTAMFKFKQHKDNPQQVPMGIPMAMLTIGVCLIFLPSFIAPAGSSIFGGTATAGGFSGGGVAGLPNANL